MTKKAVPMFAGAAGALAGFAMAFAIGPPTISDGLLAGTLLAIVLGPMCFVTVSMIDEAS